MKWRCSFEHPQERGNLSVYEALEIASSLSLLAMTQIRIRNRGIDPDE
jgi:hypothetical protein